MNWVGLELTFSILTNTSGTSSFNSDIGGGCIVIVIITGRPTTIVVGLDSRVAAGVPFHRTTRQIVEGGRVWNVKFWNERENKICFININLTTLSLAWSPERSGDYTHVFRVSSAESLDYKEDIKQFANAKSWRVSCN